MIESSLTLDLLGLVAVVVLVLLNGFFVAAEFSLVSVRQTRITELVESGNAKAKTVQQALKNPDRVIAATQLGITLASLGLGWIGEPALSHLIEPLLDLFPADLRPGLSHSLSSGLAFAIITFLHVVVGELAPKSIALQDPENTSMVVAAPTLWSERLFKPFIWALNGTGNALLRLVGVKPASGHELVHSVEELKMLVTASTKEGVVAEQESELLHAIFDFGDLLVRQVMIPRTEIIAVEADLPLTEILPLITESTYTKIPVYDDDLDNLLGIIHVKDLLRMMQEPDWQNSTVRSLVREPLYVPETLLVSALLRELRDNRQHIAIILDEFGGTAGLVTLEDLMEEIVGEVSDPFDTFTPEIEALEDGSYMIDGMCLMEDVNHALDLDLHDPAYDTIAGYTLGKLGRIPKVKDKIDSEEVTIEVEAMDGMRIDRLRLTRIEENKTSQ
ncbi:MAG: HlyC/CorC family transporter [Anaerolineales bacterium]|nr:HlyC/CorC family transporter [Anaerolineales bacterium]